MRKLKKTHNMVNKRMRGLWKFVLARTNEDFDGRMKQMLEGMKRNSG